MEKNPSNKWKCRVVALAARLQLYQISTQAHACVLYTSLHTHTALGSRGVTPCKPQTRQTEPPCKGRTTGAQVRDQGKTWPVAAAPQGPGLVSGLQQVKLAPGYATASSLVSHCKTQITFTELQSLNLVFVPIEEAAKAKRCLVQTQFNDWAYTAFFLNQQQALILNKDQ